MQDNELLQSLLYNSNDPIFAIDLNSNIIFWNSSCETFFKYTKNEVIGKKIPFVTPTSEYEIEYALNKIKNNESLNFKSQKKNKNNEVLDIIFFCNPIILENKIIGASFIVHELTTLKNLTYIPLDSETILREQKRTFNEIRHIILTTLYNSKKTINQLSIDSGVNWRTVEKHLTFLIGKKYAAEIFSSEYVRIFELTEIGREFVEKLKKENVKVLIKSNQKGL